VAGGEITFIFGGLAPGAVTATATLTGAPWNPGPHEWSWTQTTTVPMLQEVTGLLAGTYRASATWTAGGRSGSLAITLVSVPDCTGQGTVLGAPADPAVGISVSGATHAGYTVVYRDGTEAIFPVGSPPQLTSSAGSGVPSGDAVTAVPPSARSAGPFFADGHGQVFPRGPCGFEGCSNPFSLPTIPPLAAPVVAMTTVPSYASGYWMTASDGGVFSIGFMKTTTSVVTVSGTVIPGYRALPFFGSAAGLHLRAPVVGIAGTPDAGGYWLAAADGGVFTFGDAPFHGSLAGSHLDAPIVGIADTPDGRGYWLVAADGGVFTFGDAPFYGSMAGSRLDGPIVGLAATPDGKGYYLVGADGGIFTFGDATYLGSDA
jgi:hypothetical protein